VEYNIEPYKKVLEDINKMDYSSFSDDKLKEMAKGLKSRVRYGSHEDLPLVEAYALTREVSRRVLGMYPFDVQVMAAVAMHRGKIVEMQTGEGKTLTAVMPAYLNALTGKGVHILTFNQYLAQRDAEWMGPVYRFMGLSVGFVKEGMSVTERQRAYTSDITYVTAKEAGFDYLRDFMCQEKENLLHREFNFAIVDEADSILIDEARIPLVIAGNVPGSEENPVHIAQLIRTLRDGSDYGIDQYANNVFLTDSGLAHVEEILGCGNLYDQKNLELLAKVNCALFAEVLLKRDRDYIVREGKIELVDEFTGRIAEKRHWPDNLHAAVEAKEGLMSDSKGMIMGSIALQYFLELYPKVSGMTGTAHTAATELKKFYGMEVVVIPTNRPCIRQDHPDEIFSRMEAKYNALIKEIKRVHGTGQPVLIGTSSVEESEHLAEDLKKAGIECRVLNAKNDEMEAHIIARAGEYGAVTVSTNMAGRGVDIKLGGEKEQDRDRVAALGGLYVVGTCYHESVRIDNQLKGRAGRQGDPGESRFFVSLEDDFIKKYDILKLLPAKAYMEGQEAPIEDPVIRRGIEKGRRIVEGYNSDLRRQLWKYSFIVEEQRRIIHNKRQDILKDKVQPGLLSRAAGERYASLFEGVGEEVLRKVEKVITLYYINKCWADYLDYISYVRESIHLVVMGRKNPLDEFHRSAIEAFDNMKEKLESEIVNKFNTAEITEKGMQVDKEGLKGPSSTWTYLVNDSPGQFSRLPLLIKSVSTYVGGTLFSISSICKRIAGKSKRTK
jgi:preprotein translocase subunit SecA